MNDIQTLFRIAEIDPSVLSLDVHGMRLDEAKHEIEYFLDRMTRDRVRIAKIIHGKGEGVLARGLPDFLRKLPSIEKIHMPGGTHETGAVLYVSIYI